MKTGKNRHVLFYVFCVQNWSCLVTSMKKTDITILYKCARAAKMSFSLFFFVFLYFLSRNLRRMDGVERPKGGSGGEAPRENFWIFWILFLIESNNLDGFVKGRKVHTKIGTKTIFSHSKLTV